MFQGKKLLITGGTGSFGRAVLRQILKSGIEEVRILSRDEKKQDDLRREIRDTRVKFYIGDVRSARSVNKAIREIDYVFHAAALKQVPSCEFHPIEAVSTNILGTDNVLSAAIASGVRRVVCLSTDKAVYPINAMGMTKALMEKVMVASSRSLGGTDSIICGTRYGNVMASRGSVIPIFVNQILARDAITVTNPRMTRFMMSLEEAVNLVMYAFEFGENGDIFVQKSPAATVAQLAQAISELMGKVDFPIVEIGTRHGEKLHETLIGSEEMASAEDRGLYFRLPPDGRDLNYTKFVDQGDKRQTQAVEQGDYNSGNAERLSLEELKEKLLGLEYMKRILRGDFSEPEV
jgi:UDP-N-acetylglucosamine 4,6-dehydratase